MSMDKTITVQISDLRQKKYTLRYWPEDKKVRLVGYQELYRESTRKRNYQVMRWYDWHNKRDRYQDSFIPVEQIELPQSVKDTFIRELIEEMTFITTERT